MHSAKINSKPHGTIKPWIYCLIVIFGIGIASSSLAGIDMTSKIITGTTEQWHCGPDEDGCTPQGCLCIPKLSTHQPYCLDLNNLEKPCQRATPNEARIGRCAHQQHFFSSQKQCLDEYFSGGHCTPGLESRIACNMQCNKHGGDCTPIKISSIP